MEAIAHNCKCRNGEKIDCSRALNKINFVFGHAVAVKVSRTVDLSNPSKMQNEEGKYVDIYIPRKWYDRF